MVELGSNRNSLDGFVVNMYAEVFRHAQAFTNAHAYVYSLTRVHIHIH